MGIRLKLFFAQLFLSISSLSTQSQICVRNTARDKQERGDPCWQDNLIHCSRQTEIPAQENLLQKHNGRVGKLQQPDRLRKICTDAGFLKTVEVGQYLMTKHTDEFLQFAAPVTCREHTTR